MHSRVQQLKHETLKQVGIKIAERIAEHMGTRNVQQVLHALNYFTKQSTLPGKQVSPIEEARNMIRAHPQSGCGCDSFAIFTDATSGTHGFCGDDESCDGMWGYYFNGYVMRHLDPSEYAHVFSSSQVARFRDYICARELILQHPRAAAAVISLASLIFKRLTKTERCTASVEMMLCVTAFGNISVGRV